MNRSILARAAPRTTVRALTLATALLVTAGATADDAARSGSFRGLNGHETLGSASVERDGDGWRVVLGEDFSLDGAPDPKVALGKAGEYDAATLMGALESNSGAQSYTVPDGIDAAAYDEVHIWCERYSVGLGVAPIE